MRLGGNTHRVGCTLPPSVDGCTCVRRMQCRLCVQCHPFPGSVGGDTSPRVLLADACLQALVALALRAGRSSAPVIRIVAPASLERKRWESKHLMHWRVRRSCRTLAASRAWCPHRARDTPLTHPWGLDGGIHAANGPAIDEGTAPDSRLRVCPKTKGAAQDECWLLIQHTAYRPTRLFLARVPSRDLTRTYLQRVPRWWAGNGLQPSFRASALCVIQTAQATVLGEHDSRTSHGIVVRPAESAKRTTQTSTGFAHPGGQALEEGAQQLVAAGAEILVAGLAKQCGEFRLGQRETGAGEDGVHVDVLQFEGHAQLLQHQVVADAGFQRAWRLALVAAAEAQHQTVEETRQHRIGAGLEARLVFLLQPGLYLRLVERELGVGQVGDVHHLVVAEVEHVADAAQYIVVDHDRSGAPACRRKAAILRGLSETGLTLCAGGSGAGSAREAQTVQKGPNRLRCGNMQRSAAAIGGVPVRGEQQRHVVVAVVGDAEGDRDAVQKRRIGQRHAGGLPVAGEVEFQPVAAGLQRERGQVRAAAVMVSDALEVQRVAGEQPQRHACGGAAAGGVQHVRGQRAHATA
ncbi:hypothetical protein XAC2852_120152 [Xanthomonas citri pv. citri]|nr:hypothetical protein XAC2852_120152 [Xanthomonas citri pv. citri]